MVFYFTGTGNSLYVAKRIDQNPISIPQALRSGNLHFHSDSIGIVCPIYGSEPPYMVQEFLKRAQFETNYLYIIMTYGCSNGAAMQIIRKIAEECHLSLAYTRTVKMVDNYLPGFDMDAEKAIDKKVDLQMADILRDLSNRKYDLEETKPEDMAVYQNYLAFTAEHPDQGWKQVKLSTTEQWLWPLRTGLSRKLHSNQRWPCVPFRNQLPGMPGLYSSLPTERRTAQRTGG